MEVYDARLRSYDKSKLKSTSKLAWPHPDSFLASPKSLAEAGFFHNPTKEDLDSVQCFLCKTELVGWDKYDNPFEAHLGQSPECPWAIARCSLEFDVGSDGKFSIQDASRLPSNKILEKARLETFGGKLRWWKHDSAKNHGATSKKIAKAGFVYTPQDQGDDTATCFYCNLSLSGWEAGDDPIEEHKSRSDQADYPCPFFLTEVPLLSQSKQKTKATAARKSRAIKRELAPGIELETKPLLPVVSQQAEVAKKTSLAPSRKRSMKLTLIDSDTVSDDTEDYRPTAKPRASSKPLKKSYSSKEKVSGTMKKKRKTDNHYLENNDNEALGSNDMQTRPPSRLGKGKEKEKDQAKTTGNKVKPKRNRKTKGKEKDDPLDSDGVAIVERPSSLEDGKITKDSIIPAKSYKSRSDLSGAMQIDSKSKSGSTSATLKEPVVSKPRSKSTLRASRSQAARATEVDDDDDDDDTDADPTFGEALAKAASRSKKSMSSFIVSSSTMMARKRSNKTEAGSQSSQNVLDTAQSAVAERSEKWPSKASNKRAASREPVKSSRSKVPNGSKATATLVSSGQKVGTTTGGNSNDDNREENDKDADDDVSDKKTVVRRAKSDESEPSDAEGTQRTIKAQKLYHIDSDAEMDIDDENSDVAKSPSANRTRNSKHMKTNSIKAASKSLLSKRSRLRLESDQDQESEPQSKSRLKLSARPQSGIDRGCARSESPYFTATEAAVDSTAVYPDTPTQARAHASVAKPGFTSAMSSEHAGISLQSLNNPASIAAEIEMPSNSACSPAMPSTPLHAVNRAPPGFEDAPVGDERESREEAQPEGQDSQRVEVPSLTDEERLMTVEEWIRHEMAMQHDKLQQDGEIRIQAFREMAAQVRSRIETL